MNLPIKDAVIVREATTEPEFRYMHLRYHFKQLIDDLNPQGIWHNGGATIAYRVYANRLLFSYSLCSRNDLFCKARGRAIAQGRLEKGLFDEVPLTPTADIGKVFNTFIKPRVITHIESNRETWASDGYPTDVDDDGQRLYSDSISDHLY